MPHVTDGCITLCWWTKLNRMTCLAHLFVYRARDIFWQRAFKLSRCGSGETIHHCRGIKGVLKHHSDQTEMTSESADQIPEDIPATDTVKISERMVYLPVKPTALLSLTLFVPVLAKEKVKCVLAPTLKSASEKVRQGHSVAEEYFIIDLRRREMTSRQWRDSCLLWVIAEVFNSLREAVVMVVRLRSHLVCRAGRAVRIQALCAAVMSLHWFPAGIKEGRLG